MQVRLRPAVEVQTKVDPVIKLLPGFYHILFDEHIANGMRGKLF
jgi:hypothetical protein